MPHKVAVTVLGSDRPGIVCQVASLLAGLGCNIEDISQTVLQLEFAGMFVVSSPDELGIDDLRSELQRGLHDSGLHPFIKPIEPRPPQETGPVEPFVVICIGKDRVGLIAAITCVMKEHGVNITNLQFVNRTPSFPDRTVTIYEVDIPQRVTLSEFVEALQAKANEVGLEASVQHKRIFEDICRL
jgi:glycine cleavage system transcriptional repressor